MVEQHQFTTLYLEDEYATCLELNKYIQGQNNSCEEYVAQLSNWPWKTHEFVEVMNWMRRHNELYPEHQVRIVGVDMQDYQPAFEALDRLFTRHGMNTHFGKDTVVTDVSRGLLKDHTLKHLDSLTTEAKVVLNKLVLNEADSLQGITLLRHLEQSRTASQRYERSFRDVQMAENLLRDLNLKEDRKGFFWAHNGHVCNLRYQRNKKKPIVYWAGG
ncbi:MAG: erythromycin esterase family protein, partial [Flavobacteriales bacterium]